MMFISHIRFQEKALGTVVSTYDEAEQKFKVGYSICNQKDTFSKKDGRTIAMDNMLPVIEALSENGKVLNFPKLHSKSEVFKRAAISLEISRHINRAKRYYKDKVIF